MAAPRILLLGPPGAGKGTQSSNLAEEYGIEHVTTGDALRSNPDMETEFGTPRQYMEAGELVPDPVVNEIVEAALEAADGFVLDGYPRNLDQVEYLEGITDLDVVIYIDVSEAELQRRLTGRRVCSECGETYHVEFDPPEEEGVCDVCGGELIRREDDDPDVVPTRIREYEEQTEPVIEYYEDAGVLARVDGEGSPDEVRERIVEVVQREMKR